MIKIHQDEEEDRVHRKSGFGQTDASAGLLNHRLPQVIIVFMIIIMISMLVIIMITMIIMLVIIMLVIIMSIIMILIILIFSRIDGKNIDPEGDESVTLLGKPVNNFDPDDDCS